MKVKDDFRTDNISYKYQPQPHCLAGLRFSHFHHKRERERKSAMGNRRFAQISTSDEEEEAPRRPSEERLESSPRRKRLKRIKLPEDEDEPKKEPPQQTKNKNSKSNKKEKEKEPSQSSSEEEPPQEDAKAIGDSIRLSGKGRGRRSHYEAFEFDGNRYDLVSARVSSLRDICIHFFYNNWLGFSF